MDFYLKTQTLSTNSRKETSLLSDLLPALSELWVVKLNQRRLWQMLASPACQDITVNQKILKYSFKKLKRSASQSCLKLPSVVVAKACVSSKMNRNSCSSSNQRRTKLWKDLTMTIWSLRSTSKNLDTLKCKFLVINMGTMCTWMNVTALCRDAIKKLLRKHHRWLTPIWEGRLVKLLSLLLKQLDTTTQVQSSLFLTL